MLRIQLKAHVGTDGTLKLQLPTGLRETDVEVLVELHPVDAPSRITPSEGSEWPPGFFEQTFGSCEDDPLTRPSQGTIEVRERLA